jgi:hypothetical protein
MRILKISHLTHRSNGLLFFPAALLILCFVVYGRDPSSAIGEGGQRAVNPVIAEFEPALAIRAPACITCHAKIRPSIITDFGYGNRYFFGNPAGGGKFGTFDGHVYGDFYGSEPNKTGWLTAEIGTTIVVPQASFDFDLVSTGAKLASTYKVPLQAKTLAQYLQELEKQKQAPAAVIEKKTVFIGAPTAAALEARFNISPGSDEKLRFFKTESTSPEIEGIGLSPSKDFYTNTAEVVCDGDLLVRGTLFLNQATIATKTGCRIYCTGPIFMQGGLTYKNRNASLDETNLQLVSAQAILLGVGDKSCDATYKDSPLSRRLVSGYAVSTFMTREASSASTAPQTWGKGIYAQGRLIPDLEDAGCRNDTISFSRLLLNAPQVHSRYRGDFKGLVIAEFALFRLGKSNFEFDPVFKMVPVLPRLQDSDYLVIK